MIDILNKYGDYETYSFDVFDTVMGRITLDPKGVFALMQQELITNNEYSDLPNTLITDFSFHRQYNETYARRFSHRKIDEITLEEIYNRIAHGHGLTPNQVQKLIDLENNTEISVGIAIPDIVDDLILLKKLGKRVLLISDMYLSHNTIRSMLDRACPELKDIPLYVSSSYRVTKRKGGKLFTYIQKELNLSKSWLHIGDNAVADKKMPELIGITGKLVNHYNNPSIFKTMEKALQYNTYAQLWMGIASHGRRKADCYKNKNRYKVGLTYGAPILISYVEWILNQAIERNIRALNFLARDGYILKNIADQIIEKRGLQIKTAYIYSSRKAWSENAFANNRNHCIESYLKDNVLVYKNKIAFVDSMGTGVTVNRMFQHMDIWKNYEHIIFAINGRKGKNTDSIIKYDFLEFLDVYDSIENFCKSMDGQTEGYHLEGDKVVPITNEYDGYKLKAFGYADYINGIYDFLKIYLNYNSVVKKVSYSSIMEVNQWYLRVINHYLDEDIIQFLGDFPKDNIGRTFKYSKLGRKYIKLEMRFKRLRALIKYIEKEKLCHFVG